MTAEVGQQVWVTSTEYVTVDVHGNVTVVDTLLTGLNARWPAAGAVAGTRTTAQQAESDDAKGAPS